MNARFESAASNEVAARERGDGAERERERRDTRWVAREKRVAGRGEAR